MPYLVSADQTPINPPVLHLAREQNKRVEKSIFIAGLVSLLLLLPLCSISAAEVAVNGGGREEWEDGMQ